MAAGFVKSDAPPLEAGAPKPRRAPSPRSRDVAGLRALVSDEHYKHSLAIVRHLGRLGVHVEVVAASRSSLACRSRYCRSVVLSRSGCLEDLVEATLAAVRAGRFDLVIPVSYSMTRALARRRDELLGRARLELAETAAIELAADKLKMTELAASVGVPVPKTLPAGEAAEPSAAG